MSTERRFLFSVRSFHVAVAGLLTLTAAAGVRAADQGKAQQKPESAWKMPRTDYGQPDLQGFWTNATITPLERDPQFGDRLVLSPQEATAVEQGLEQFRAEADKPTDPKLGIQDLPHECGFGFSGVNCGYNLFWVDPGSKLVMLNGEKRSSIIVEPKNGKVPPLTPAGQARLMRMYSGYVDAERLTRIGPHQIDYQFTIEDPTTFTQSWRGELAFNRTEERMHEYACHEGNYALPGILAGAREEERNAAAKRKP